MDIRAKTVKWSIISKALQAFDFITIYLLFIPLTRLHLRQKKLFNIYFDPCSYIFVNIHTSMHTFDIYIIQNSTNTAETGMVWRFYEITHFFKTTILIFFPPSSEWHIEYSTFLTVFFLE